MDVVVGRISLEGGNPIVLLPIQSLLGMLGAG